MKTKLQTIIIALAWCLFPQQTARADDCQSLFLQANEQYKKGNVEQARTLYQKIVNKSPQVYYNIGNCEYRLNHPGYAMLYWRRAERDWGIWDRDDLVKNIELLKKSFSRHQHEPNKTLSFFTH